MHTHTLLPTLLLMEWKRQTAFALGALAVSLQHPDGVAVRAASSVAHAQSVDPAQKAPTYVTSKDGTRIGFDRTGEGPVLVLVAGALSDRSSTTRLAALLSERSTVINYDRRGRGESTDTLPYAVEREVEDIEALIDAAGGSASVFGHSSGAVLALEAAARLPAKVRKQVLFEPPFVVDDSRPRVPEDFVAHIDELIAAGKRGDAVAYFMTDAVGVPAEFVDGMKKSPMWAAMERTAHTLAYDGRLMGDTQAGKPLPAERWKTAKAPALVLSGGASEPWLHAAAEALAALLPDAEHRVLEGLDHAAAVMAAEKLVPVLAEFLAD